MAAETSGAKEANILSSSESILKKLEDFQERLDNRFSRSVKGGDVATGRPQPNNVLDEILENLGQADQHLASIMSFISSDVLPKIN